MTKLLKTVLVFKFSSQKLIRVQNFSQIRETWFLQKFQYFLLLMGGDQNDNFLKNGPRFQIRHPKIDPGAKFQPNRRNLIFNQNFGIFCYGGGGEWSK